MGSVYDAHTLCYHVCHRLQVCSFQSLAFPLLSMFDKTAHKLLIVPVKLQLSHLTSASQPLGPRSNFDNVNGCLQFGHFDVVTRALNFSASFIVALKTLKGLRLRILKNHSSSLSKGDLGHLSIHTTSIKIHMTLSTHPLIILNIPCVFSTNICQVIWRTLTTSFTQ